MLKKIILCSAFIFSITLPGCGNRKTTRELSEKKDSIQIPTDSFEMEHMAVNMVFDLPEVKMKSEEIDKKNNLDLSALVTDYPHQNKKGYFNVEISASSSDIYPLPFFNFHVYFPSLDILFLDTITKKEIPLDEWRKLPK